MIVEQVTIIVHYVGRDLSEQNKRTTQYHFANALRTYDDFAEALKKGDDAKSLQKILLAHFVETYKALGYGEEVAKHNCEWWINWAYSRISQKKVDVVDDAQSETLFRLYFDKVVDNIFGEHQAKYEFKTDAATGLTGAFIGAIYLGHNTRDWSLAEQMLSIYYKELFSKLSEIQKIRVNAEKCASNSWWQAHDERRYEDAATQFLAQEIILSEHIGNKINRGAAVTCFVTALQTYDRLTEKLISSEGTSDLEKELSTNMVNLHSALGLNNQVADSVFNWWLYWAKSQVARKKGETEKYEQLSAQMFQNLANEHRLKFKIKGDQAMGLAHSEATAGYLAHTTRNWDKAHGLLVVYYRELFSQIRKK